MRWYFALLAGILLSTSACNDNSATKDVKKTSKTANSKLDDAATQHIIQILHAYYTVKDALVHDLAIAADTNAQHLMIATRNALAGMQTDSVTMLAIQQHADTLMKGITGMQSVKDESCEIKRIHFEKVSNAMYAILKLAEVKNGGIYRQYCPMAFNDKGAYWLSNDMEIQNPYFGKKMPECGEITDSL